MRRCFGGRSGWARDLVGKWLILRFTARGLCRPRLRSAGTSAISIRMASSIRARPSGGKSDVEGKIAPDNLDRVHEGQGVRITGRPAAGLDHQLANGEVGQEKADLPPLWRTPQQARYDPS